MNAYLSREEKANYIRATALAAQLELTIDSYASAKNTDPEFLKYLRMGRTMLTKALIMRSDALDIDVKNEFAKQVSRLELICAATPEAKKAHKELLELQTTLPMELQDFEDWYESVIETTCKKCLCEDFTECKTRRVLVKYGVYPIDPGAIEKCQYSYIGTAEAEELQPVEDEMVSVPGMVYNAALAMVKAKEDSINDNYVPLIKQLQAEINTAKAQLVDILYFEDDRPENPGLDELIVCVKESFQTCDTQDREQMEEEILSLRDQVTDAESKLTAANEAENKIKHIADTALDDVLRLTKERDKFQQQVSDLQIQLQTAAAIQEQPKEEYPVTIGLASGGEFDYVLPARMTETMIKEIQQPRYSRGTCAQYVAGKLIAIDLQEVVTLHVDKLPQVDWLKKKAMDPVVSIPPAPSKEERYRIECSCGAEYFANMYNGFQGGRNKGRCRECQNTVFADRQADKVNDPADGVKATLLTNRYFVSWEPYQVRESTPEKSVKRDLKNISQNHGREYKDPCQLLE
jgi:hypothetical protein